MRFSSVFQPDNVLQIEQWAGIDNCCPYERPRKDVSEVLEFRTKAERRNGSKAAEAGLGGTDFFSAEIELIKNFLWLK